MRTEVLSLMNFGNWTHQCNPHSTRDAQCFLTSETSLMPHDSQFYFFRGNYVLLSILKTEFTYSRISHKWSNTVCSTLCLILLSIIFFVFIHDHVCIKSLSLFVLIDTLLYGFTTFCLFILPLMDIWVFSVFCYHEKCCHDHLHISLHTKMFLISLT